MIFFKNDNLDPYFNLALEEVLLKSNIKENILLLWQNHNSIIVGRNQNSLEEINVNHTDKDKVRVVRRMSGGGAVFHDLGNLNFSFILNRNDDNAKSYSVILQPIIDALQNMGLNAVFSGKNDITIDDKKISGNAQYAYKDRLLHHGTILFNVDLTKLGNYLNVSKQKIISKGIKSNQSRVINVKELLNNDMTLEDFKLKIIESYVNKNNAKVEKISENYINQAKQLAKEKYNTFEWNFGKSPEFTIQNKVYFNQKGLIEFKAFIENGFIKTINFYGDFLGFTGTKYLEDALVGVKLNYNSVKKVINNSNYQDIFGEKFLVDEILSVIFE
ncbi:lipoate--protein ligase [Spiroplasma endosymbiont of Anurida maritima]|uniref:lipoate--protein ligase n=1 Tax=Spiroplasma endosymbiont of Anurida maritima TaxID=2967972 RepID=UPI0036D23011